MTKQDEKYIAASLVMLVKIGFRLWIASGVQEKRNEYEYQREAYHQQLRESRLQERNGW